MISDFFIRRPVLANVLAILTMVIGIVALFALPVAQYPDVVPPTVQVTTRFPSVHGAPVHLGKPELIGIKDIAKPDYGDAVPVKDDEFPVFWACGVTPQSVVATVKPEFCITHAPGYMLVTDLLNSQLAVL